MLSSCRSTVHTIAVSALALVVLCTPATGRAHDFELFGHTLSLRGANTFEYTYHLDNDGNDDPRFETDDEYHEVFDTLDVTLSAGDVRLGGRFDFYTYAARPFDRLCGPNAPSSGEPSWCNQHESRYVNQYFLYRRQAIMPERLYLEIARPEMEVTLGDFYATLGKGIALSAIKRDELGQDTAIRGGKLAIHHADFGLTFLAGEFNPLDIDNATARIAPWAKEPVVAGQVEQRFFETLLAGAHAVLILSEGHSSSAARTNHHAVYGGRLEAPALLDGRLSVAAEVDLQRTVDFGEVVRGPDRDEGDPFSSYRGDGLALYATSTVQLGDWTLLGEFKHYDDLLLRGPAETVEPYALLYNQPPTLERIKAEVTDNQGTTGARLRVDRSLSEDLLLFANYGFFSTRFEGDHQVHDPFVGLELSWADGDGQLSVTAGARYERDEARDALYRLDVHGEVSLEQALWASHSVKLTAFYQRRRKEIATWNELDTALEYKWSPRISAAITLERGRDTDTFSEQWYLGGSTRYFFTPSTYVEVRGGQNRGGVKCLSGACRLFPPFAGLRASAVAQF